MHVAAAYTELYTFVGVGLTIELTVSTVVVLSIFVMTETMLSVTEVTVVGVTAVLEVTGKGVLVAVAVTDEAKIVRVAV